MEIEKFFKENIKPLISDKLEEIEESVDLNELNSYRHYDAWLNHEPASDDYDEDEMYEVCVDQLVGEIEEYGVLEVFETEMSKDAAQELYEATAEEHKALDKMTIQYIEE